MPLFLVSGAKGTRMLFVNFFAPEAQSSLKSGVVVVVLKLPLAVQSLPLLSFEIGAEDTPARGMSWAASDRAAAQRRVFVGASASSLA